MMVNILLLADKAEQLFQQNSNLSRLAAARIVVRGQGIFHEPDVERLAKQIHSELSRRGGKQTARRKAKETATRKLHERIAP